MELKNILAISGKPGLYRMVSSTASRLVVESIADHKKLPIPASSKVSSLEDIAIFTTEEEVPLAEVFARIYTKTEQSNGPDHKAPSTELRSYISEVLEDLDHERVYDSDLKKLFNWYNILFNDGFFTVASTAPDEESTDPIEQAEAVTSAPETNEEAAD